MLLVEVDSLELEGDLVVDILEEILDVDVGFTELLERGLVEEEDVLRELDIEILDDEDDGLTELELEETFDDVVLVVFTELRLNDLDDEDDFTELELADILVLEVVVGLIELEMDRDFEDDEVGLTVDEEEVGFRDEDDVGFTVVLELLDVAVDEVGLIDDELLVEEVDLTDDVEVFEVLDATVLVGLHAPVTDGTAFTPEPMGMIFVPQSTYCARRRLSLS
ncbi:hypothetical protein DL95DRAFT_525851 [Leptodontidium sp. 2 PMI_412]|nr:hypothetical protein BKA61DRAFT_667984 [Leptodontidium sp. MPI-SDFR-AT-0119]KAH9211207.1 hypothetical protein DL95DRAFT_525851 [Leptodontidium sp. 2 PMI_412]